MNQPSVQLPFDLFLPESSWQLPTDFPDLIGRDAPYISIDIETRDPYLKEKGPGFPREEAQTVGVAVSTNGFSQYYPVRHAVGPNLAPNVVFNWLREQLKGQQDKITANGIYDFEGLWYENIKEVGGKIHDIQIAEPLIDEETAAGYSLEALSNKYLGKGKDETKLREAAAFHRANGKAFNPKTDLWLLSPKYVAEYAIADAVQTAEIFFKQRAIMEKDGLTPIYNLEIDVMPTLLQMRTHGIKVDLEKAERLRKLLTLRLDALTSDIVGILGRDVNIDSGPELRSAYELLNQKYGAGVSFSYLPSGAPTFNKKWLELQTDPLSKLVSEKRRLTTLRDDFVVGDIIRAHHKGRIYARFHQLREDDAGTRSGRMASSAPNLQQVPARDEEWAPEIRSLFIADDGKIFFKGDYSQQEPRWLIHYAFKAGVPGADAAVAQFQANPLTDYHQYTTDVVNAKTGKGFKRKRIKGVNLGVMYTMGLLKLCAQLDVTIDEGKEILHDYHLGLPFVRAISNLAMTTAQVRGFTRTMLGRLHRYNLYQPVPNSKAERSMKHKGLPLAEARAKWVNRKLERWGTHKALNRLIQGSSADQTKRSLVIARVEYGLYPQLIIHDENAGSVDDVKQAKTWKRIMETAVTLVIPVVCDMRIGPNWGYAKDEVLL